MDRAVYAVRGSADVESSADCQIIFDREVTVQTKHLDREESCQPLQLCVTKGHGGANGTSRYVGFRLTDPRDPFFLFTMTLLEDEYGRFKERHELNVDFTGFPTDIVAMLEKAASGASQYTLVFLVDTAQSGTLRFLERTGFRSLEYLSLQMAKQGDIGQKRYLAERCQYFESAYHRIVQERQELDARQTRAIGDLRRDFEALKADRDELRQKLRVEATEADSTRIAAIANLKDELNNENRRIQAQAETDRVAQQRKYEEQVAQLRVDLRSREDELSEVKTMLQHLESDMQQAKGEIRGLHDAKRTLEAEREKLLKDNAELINFRHAATKTMTDGELKHVSMTERLHHFTETLRDKEEEMRVLKQHAEHQEHYAKMLKEQLEAATEKAKKAEAGLSKSHHIMSGQLQALRVGKERHTALSAQLQASDSALAEKTTQIERLKAELTMSTDRLDLFQEKVSEMKDQLQRSEEQNQKLQSQLKQNEDALIHLQRMTSGVGSRSWPATTAAVSPPPVLGSVPFSMPPNLYSEFRRNLPATAAASASFSQGNTSISRPGGISSVDDQRPSTGSLMPTPAKVSATGAATSSPGEYPQARQPASSYFPTLQAA